MRGKHEPCGNKAKHTGITPADAGKTPNATVAEKYAQDHPRGCGENKMFFKMVSRT